jgi:hypothetical protein
MITDKDIQNWFTYHVPTSEQIPRYEAIRSKARELAIVILENTKASEDQSVAFRLLRETIMTANASIACENL